MYLPILELDTDASYQSTVVLQIDACCEVTRMRTASHWHRVPILRRSAAILPYYSRVPTTQTWLCHRIHAANTIVLPQIPHEFIKHTIFSDDTVPLDPFSPACPTYSLVEEMWWHIKEAFLGPFECRCASTPYFSDIPSQTQLRRHARVARVHTAIAGYLGHCSTSSFTYFYTIANLAHIQSS